MLGSGVTPRRGKRLWPPFAGELPGRQGVAFGATLLLGPLAVGLLVAHNSLLGVVFVAGALVVYLAVRSLAFPVALAGVPSLLIGLYGSDPLPSKGVFALLTVWLFLGLGLAFLSGAWPSSEAARWTLAPPLVLIAVLATLLIVRLDPGSYPKSKVELFLAQSVPLLVAGMLIGLRATTFRLYVLLTLAVSLISAVGLTRNLSSNSATQVFTGRYTIGTAYNPIWAGRTAAIGVLIALALILGGFSRRATLVGYVSLPFLAIALLASGSRGPVVALLVALVVLVSLVIQNRQLRRRLAQIAVGVGGATVVAALIVPSTAVDRSASFLFGNTSGLSSNGRTHLWSQALSLFYSHFWTGVGTGGFSRYEPIYLYPHNIVLEEAAELGVLGVILVVAFLLLALRTAFFVWREATSHEERIIGALILAMLVATVLNSLLSDAIETTDTLCLVVGLAYGLHARARARPLESPSSSPIAEPART
jgi:O-antigen ligase